MAQRGQGPEVGDMKGGGDEPFEGELQAVGGDNDALLVEDNGDGFFHGDRRWLEQGEDAGEEGAANQNPAGPNVNVAAAPAANQPAPVLPPLPLSRGDHGFEFWPWLGKSWTSLWRSQAWLGMAVLLVGQFILGLVYLPFFLIGKLFDVPLVDTLLTAIGAGLNRLLSRNNQESTEFLASRNKWQALWLTTSRYDVLKRIGQLLFAPVTAAIYLVTVLARLVLWPILWPITALFGFSLKFERVDRFLRQTLGLDWVAKHLFWPLVLLFAAGATAFSTIASFVPGFGPLLNMLVQYVALPLGLAAYVHQVRKNQAAKVEDNWDLVVFERFTARQLLYHDDAFMNALTANADDLDAENTEKAEKLLAYVNSMMAAIHPESPDSQRLANNDQGFPQRDRPAMLANLAYLKQRLEDKLFSHTLVVVGVGVNQFGQGVNQLKAIVEVNDGLSKFSLMQLLPPVGTTAKKFGAFLALLVATALGLTIALLFTNLEGFADVIQNFVLGLMGSSYSNAQVQQYFTQVYPTMVSIPLAAAISLGAYATNVLGKRHFASLAEADAMTQAKEQFIFRNDSRAERAQKIGLVNEPRLRGWIGRPEDQVQWLGLWDEIVVYAKKIVWPAWSRTVPPFSFIAWYKDARSVDENNRPNTEIRATVFRNAIKSFAYAAIIILSVMILVGFFPYTIPSAQLIVAIYLIATFVVMPLLSYIWARLHAPGAPGPFGQPEIDHRGVELNNLVANDPGAGVDNALAVAPGPEPEDGAVLEGDALPVEPRPAAPQPDQGQPMPPRPAAQPVRPPVAAGDPPAAGVMAEGQGPQLGQPGAEGGAVAFDAGAAPAAQPPEPQPGPLLDIAHQPQLGEMAHPGGPPNLQQGAAGRGPQPVVGPFPEGGAMALDAGAAPQPHPDFPPEQGQSVPLHPAHPAGQAMADPVLAHGVIAPASVQPAQSIPGHIPQEAKQEAPAIYLVEGNGDIPGGINIVWEDDGSLEQGDTVLPPSQPADDKMAVEQPEAKADEKTAPHVSFDPAGFGAFMFNPKFRDLGQALPRRRLRGMQEIAQGQPHHMSVEEFLMQVISDMPAAQRLNGGIKKEDNKLKLVGIKGRIVKALAPHMEKIFAFIAQAEGKDTIERAKINAQVHVELARMKARMYELVNDIPQHQQVLSNNLAAILKALPEKIKQQIFRSMGAADAKSAQLPVDPRVQQILQAEEQLEDGFVYINAKIAEAQGLLSKKNVSLADKQNAYRCFNSAKVEVGKVRAQFSAWCGSQQPRFAMDKSPDKQYVEALYEILKGIPGYMEERMTQLGVGTLNPKHSSSPKYSPAGHFKPGAQGGAAPGAGSKVQPNSDEPQPGDEHNPAAGNGQ